LTFYSLPLQTPGYRGRLPWANLPKQKEPPHRGDIGWGRFLLRQFVHYPVACDLKYKLRDNKDHPDVFMRLFASSLTGDAEVWIDGCPKGSIKNIEELQKAFKIRWCDSEHSQDSFSQYLNICKGPCESIRDFSDRFNLFLKKI
jgi:hypothetical protein